ncbi:transposase [Telmatospirillum siberiense]|uniref:Transposase IS200-like domain-containing protein n=1 Tax=Telmatospirillum siberiense TaxID=382514 RepID=A0A2N3PRR2_9PROT|nr:transposase [Telmatospirillum siberiense]PKU23072.1 hypothetical protein CWS72_18770 [Telmatospirillum siberiense]
MPGPLHFSRRNLPHFRLDGASYFITWRLHPTQKELSETERDGVVAILRRFEGHRYRLHGYVVMNDHVHVMVEAVEPWRLHQILHSWKSFSAYTLQRRYGRLGSVWQDESFDRVIRDEAEYAEKRTYILNNPAKRWPNMAGYPWVWAVGE